MNNKNNEILLSICIPTYNRASFLKETLQSIVIQKRFLETSDVEIIISDNCSNDETQIISFNFIKSYGQKIKYFRNSLNIKDLNFEKVLSYGQGLFLKLNNDTLQHDEGSLDKMLHIIQENIQSKNIVFFSNGYLNFTHPFICNNLNDFVKHVSYWSTWIANFGIWNEDFNKLDNFSRYSHLQLIQTDVLLRLINSPRKVFVNNDKLFNSIAPPKKGGYDLLTVFLDNYFFLLTEYLNNNSISKKNFVNEKKKILLDFILPWLINIKTNPKIYTFEFKNSFKRIADFCNTDYVTLFLFTTRYYYCIIRNLIKKGMSIPLNKQQ